MSAPVWFRLLSSPVRNVIKDDSALPFIDPGEAVHRLLVDVGTFRSDSEGETPNVTVIIDNDDARASALFARAVPPVGCIGEIRSRDGVLYSGIVRTISFDNDCRIGVQS